MDMTSALAAFSALSQETRLQVFRLLMTAGPDGMGAGAIAERTGVLHNTLSSHLAVLTRAGLLRQTRRGRAINYAVDIDGVQSLIAYLVDECCGGNPEICGPWAALQTAGARGRGSLKS